VRPINQFLSEFWVEILTIIKEESQTFLKISGFFIFRLVSNYQWNARKNFYENAFSTSEVL
jgi:hypothetical protein